MSATRDTSRTPSLGSADVVLDETRMMLKAAYNLAAKPGWPHDSQCSARS
jgi:hypothetical protein